MALSIDEQNYLRPLKAQGQTTEQLTAALKEYRAKKVSTPSAAPALPSMDQTAATVSKPSLLDVNPEPPKPRIQASPWESLAGNVAKGAGDLWNAGAGAVTGAAKATWNAAADPMGTLQAGASAVGGAASAVGSAATSAWNDPLKFAKETVANPIGGAVSEVPNIAGNLLNFAGQGLGTIADFQDPLQAQKEQVRNQIKDAEAKGITVPKEYYDFVNARPGEVFRKAGKIAKETEDVYKQGVTDIGRGTGLYETESAGGGVGKFATQLAVASSLMQGLGLNAGIPEKILGKTNLGTELLSTAKNPGSIKKILRATLNTVSNKAAEWAPVVKSGVFTQAVNDAVTKGETNSASLITGVLLNKALQSASSKLKERAITKYGGSFSTQIPIQGKGATQRMVNEYKETIEEGLKKGWTAPTTQDFQNLMASEKQKFFATTDKIMQQKLSQAKPPSIDSSLFVSEVKDEVKDMIKAGLRSEAKAVNMYLKKNILPLSKNGTLELGQLDNLKKGLNKILKKESGSFALDPRNIEEVTYAKTVKPILDTHLNDMLGPEYAAANKAANAAYRLEDLAAQRAGKEMNIISSATDETRAAAVSKFQKAEQAKMLKAAQAGKIKGATLPTSLQYDAAKNMLKPTSVLATNLAATNAGKAVSDYISNLTKPKKSTPNKK